MLGQDQLAIIPLRPEGLQPVQSKIIFGINDFPKFVKTVNI